MKAGRIALIAALVLVAGLVPAATAAADQGPPLTVPAKELAASLTCTADVDRAKRDPVLLFPAFSTAQESYGATYLKDLPKWGFPTCSITLADRGYGDLQRAAEFAVYAIRTVSERSGRQVSVLGHQHGGIDWLLALRFWPDVPAKVSDYISLAAPHHGTEVAATVCTTLRCSPSQWQIRTGSKLLTAVNRKPAPRGPSYTSISTAYDELITPQPAASHMLGARNIVLQDVCPGRLVEHFTILVDPLTNQLVRDALEHPGPADPSRLAKPCSTSALGLPTLAGLPGLLGFGLRFTVNGVVATVPSEPTLRPQFATG
ncbi:lipase [Kribbella sp. NBC_01505]|uniref:esterase/lipase family protein n=1 Tax=Kribbella sp. NBC_01505 TaxID=2903580 RepID=UPI00386D2A1E